MTQQQPPIDSVFVYGTLKRGQCRETVWPVEPTEITAGWAYGTLYGRDDYPALLHGEHRVIGEIWKFDLSQMRDVLAVLDDVEGTEGNSPNDLYHRHVVDARSDRGTIVQAYAYFYNRDPIADGFVIVPANDAAQSWPD